jgi:predicted Holliday junction resolvase-like endonuclease
VLPHLTDTTVATGMAEQTMLQLLQQQQQQIQQQNIQIQQQQQQMEQQNREFREQQCMHAKVLEVITEKLQSMCTQKTTSTAEPRLKETLAAGIQEFRYEPEEGVNFSAWYKRYEDIFLFDAESMNEASKVRLLMQKLGASEHARYCNFLLPKSPRDFSFSETVEKLTAMFGERTSLFNIRYNCLKIAHQANEDIVSYTGRVNKECERFQLSKLSYDQFKSLIFVAGLTLPEEADLRTRLLAKLDSSTDLTIQELSDEYVRLQNIKHDTQMIQNNAEIAVSAASVEQVTRNTRSFNQNTPRVSKRPPTACWNCGRWHFARFCPFRNYMCQKCGAVGHNEARCRQSFKPVSNVRFRR